MKRNYFLKSVALPMLFFIFSLSAFSQGDCDNLTLPIQAQMGLDDEPADFFVRAGSQNGRIFRDGVATICPSKAYPGDFNPALPYNWTAIRLYNSSTDPVCITVTADVDSGPMPCTTNGHAQVYQSADGLETEPYDPANQPTNFIGDIGSSVSQPFSVEVVPGWFEVVFTNTAAPDNCDFSFTIDDGGTGVILCDEPPANVTVFQLNKIELYPNPATNEVNIKLPVNLTISNIELINITGNIMFSGISADKINLSGLASGVYFVKVTSESSSITKKLVVK